MQVILSLILVVGSLAGGFYLAGGYMGNLWQPFEVLMIGGSGIGFFLASNSMHGVKMFGRYIKYALFSPYDKDKFQQLMGFMTSIHTRYVQDKKALSKDLENLETFDLLLKYDKIAKDDAAKHFILNNIITMIDEGSELTPFEYEEMFYSEQIQYKKESMTPYKSATSLVDAFPALGIAAAVMGITIALQYLDAGMMKLGSKIGAALFGTFFGVFLGYGVCKPFAVKFSKVSDEADLFNGVISTYLMCIVKGYPPMKAATITNRDVPPRFKLDTAELRDKIISKTL